MNKIISKFFASRLENYLPMVMVPNQSGFIKGRTISDNVLLAKELFHDIWRGVNSPNLILKLDMEKAYDKVQWPFLVLVMRKMGFPELWVKLIENCISPYWFPMLVNGCPMGFFKSSRGLRQGDHISLSCFFIDERYNSSGEDFREDTLLEPYTIIFWRKTYSD